MNNNFPKILSNIPEGKDLFKAESHKKIASTISNVIEFQSNSINKQIIGLEGKWGTGKSNIIKIIEEEISKKSCLKDKYVFFNYDTWTHQEDLTRKSILIELINSLRKNIDTFKSDNWIDKEAKLSQKRISKNTKHFPQVKLYYVFLVLGFVIIKFINETKKQVRNGKLYGYYDDSLNYLKDEFYLNISNNINFTYFYKLFPYLLFLISLILFFKSFTREFIENYKKEDKDKSKLTFWGLIGKSFYWISGEKLETNSDETITEIEPSNLRFRNFLREIDEELISNNKKLILTIDNTDRLTDDKLKSIWSTINIFFAENNNQNYLKNIWLIVPYDFNKVIDLFKDNNIGTGLLEKTFAITFTVPPPLNSNWEEFFKISFNTSFKNIKIEDIDTELEVLLKLYDNYEEEITPRKIIIFINQLATFYIQNPKIKLRYYTLYFFKKEIFLNGNINDMIINRSSYLSKISYLFIDDELLELQLAKIIYGVESDEAAKESLLHNLITDKLKRSEDLDDEIINLPYFLTYFYNNFKSYIDTNAVRSEQNYDYITNLLNNLEETFTSKSKQRLYKELWEYYSIQVNKGSFQEFNDTLKSVCLRCSKTTKNEILNYLIYSLSRDDIGTLSTFNESQKIYVNFLKEFYSFNKTNKSVALKELKINDYFIGVDQALEIIDEDRDFINLFKLKINDKIFKDYLKEEPLDKVSSIAKHINHHEGLLALATFYKFDFFASEINTFFKKHVFKNLDEINVFFFYKLKLEKIILNELEVKSFTSLHSILLNLNSNDDCTNLVYLIISNYKKPDYDSLILSISKAFNNLNALNIDNNKIVDYFDSQSFSSLLILFLDIPQNNTIKDILLKAFKKHLINQEQFNFIFKNYTSFSSSLDNDNFNTFDFLNKNYNDFEIDLSLIDLNIINSSKKKLNLKLIKEVNKNLLDVLKNDSRFLQNNITKNFLFFIKLVELDKSNKELFNNNLASSFCDLFTEYNVESKIKEDNLLKIKNNIESNYIVEYLKAKNLNFNSLISRGNSYLASPEIFILFDRINNVVKLRILENIVSRPKFYSKELIDEVLKLGNNILVNNLKKGILLCSKDDVVNYAIEKGIIEPNLN